MYIPSGSNFFALKRGVEHAKIGRGIGATAGDPLPVDRVIGKIGIDQRVPEPCLTLPPVDPQVLDQKARRDHAHTIVHPAGLPELAHPGVHHRITRTAVLPCCKVISLALPGEGVELRTPVLLGHGRKVIQQVIGELSPSQFAEELFRSLGLPRVIKRGRNIGPYVPWLKSRPNAGAATASMCRQDPADRDAVHNLSAYAG